MVGGDARSRVFRQPHAHSAIGVATPSKVLYDKEAYLSSLTIIEARAFVQYKTHTKRLDDKACKGKLCGFSVESKIYRIYNPVARKAMVRRNVIFIETPPNLFPPPSVSICPTLDGENVAQCSPSRHPELNGSHQLVIVQ